MWSKPLLLFVSFVCLFVFSFYSVSGSTSDTAHLYFFNLPDGEATLIQTPEQTYYLINTGSNASQGELFEKLERLAVTKIEGLLLTSQADPYAGNVEEVIKHFKIDNVYLAQGSSMSSQGETDVNFVTRNDQLELARGYQVQILATHQSGTMSLLLKYGENAVLYMGIDDPLHDLMLQEDRINPNIIKIADFAQGYSPSEALLDVCDPHVSIIFHERSGDVNEELIDRLHASWIDVYQLKQVGTTIIQMTKNDYEIIP